MAGERSPRPADSVIIISCHLRQPLASPLCVCTSCVCAQQKGLSRRGKSLKCSSKSGCCEPYAVCHPVLLNTGSPELGTGKGNSSMLFPMAPASMEAPYHRLHAPISLFRGRETNPSLPPGSVWRINCMAVAKRSEPGAVGVRSSY